MDQLVQLAVTTVNKGDKNKAMEYLKQAIASNANDVDAWLVLSALIDQPERKRQCLNRVLMLDPAHKIAREEMLKLDRAAMGNIPIAEPSQPIQENSIRVSQPQEKPVQTHQPALNSRVDFGTETLSDQSRPMSVSAVPKHRISKPLVFRYPILILLATYSFAILFFFANITAIQEPSMFLILCGLSLACLVSIWIVSAKIEINEEGISSSRMFGVVWAQVKWNEIKSIEPAGQGLDLVAQNGSSVKITSQVNGYPSVVKILRERRSDLFDITPSVRAGGENEGFLQPSSSFAGKKIFKKGFLRRFGSYVLTIPFFLLCIWMIFTNRDLVVVWSIAAVIGFVMTLSPLFDVFELTVGENKIKLVSLLDEQEFVARQIREVKMKSVRKRSVVYYFLVIVTEKGKEYTLQGFAEGNQILYGFLLNWWNTYHYQ